MMKQCRAICNGRAVAGRIDVADSFFTRLRGLMYTKSLGDRYGLLLSPCGAVHTFGMRYAIDVVYLSASGEVLRVECAMQPRRAGRAVPGSRQVLELAAGEARQIGIARGDILKFER
ncbi:MAG: DUF192 domain-containing protein [Clostridia bacterium]|nr:DUF192 domain-containing protein [Clostridia bacterium]MDR3643748.1 DUF192 domain-containing protein [Clostridia bacterium]